MKLTAAFVATALAISTAVHAVPVPGPNATMLEGRGTPQVASFIEARGLEKVGELANVDKFGNEASDVVNVGDAAKNLDAESLMNSYQLTGEFKAPKDLNKNFGLSNSKGGPKFEPLAAHDPRLAELHANALARQAFHAQQAEYAKSMDEAGKSITNKPKPKRRAAGPSGSTHHELQPDIEANVHARQDFYLKDAQMADLRDKVTFQILSDRPAAGKSLSTQTRPRGTDHK